MSADFFASNLTAAPSPVAAPPPPTSSVVRAGLWQLHAHQALGLRPAIDRGLHIASGRVWVTLHAPAHAAAPYRTSTRSLELLRYSEYLVPRRGQVLSDLESCRS
ncbi:MAG: hypothetical protein RLZZ612_1594 [Pseudomonadota bacterium]|jgi:hypothetical protein